MGPCKFLKLSNPEHTNEEMAIQSGLGSPSDDAHGLPGSSIRFCSSSKHTHTVTLTHTCTSMSIHTFYSLLNIHEKEHTQTLLM